jgi:hypothetical protein
MRCFDTGKLSESVIRNGSVTPDWVGALLVWVRLCRSNMMTVADAKRFVASKRARRSGIAAPLWHIWLPAAPLRQLASSYEHACKSSPALHRMHAWWFPDRVLGKSAFFMIFRLEAVPEQTVRRYFLQGLVSWIYRFPGSRMPVGSTGTNQNVHRSSGAGVYIHIYMTKIARWGTSTKLISFVAQIRVINKPGIKTKILFFFEATWVEWSMFEP